MSAREDAELRDRALSDRVMGCLPVGAQGFAELLGLLSIEASDAVPTACVTTGARSRMLINPAFVERHCRDDDQLAMLVMHELHHVLLGHTRLYPRVTPAQNWAFDCLINAQLCRLFPGPRHVAFFGQFAWEAQGAARLLGPPLGWRPDAAWKTLMRDARARREDPGYGRARAQLESVHWRLYDDESVGTEELYRLLERVGAAGATAAAPTRSDPPVLLGNHGADDDAPLHPEVLREVREIVARWPMIDRRSGRDQGGAMTGERVPLAVRRTQAVTVLRRAIGRVAQVGDAGTRRLDGTVQASLGPLPQAGDRRAGVQRLLGAEPLLWRGELAVRAPVPTARVAVYLDVSGSMDTVLPVLYAALAGCLDAVEPLLRGFSTAIGTLTHAQLRAGLRLTTGGTDIATVTADLLARRVRRALIVTDGWVGTVPADHLRELRARRVRIAVALTAPGDPAFARPPGWPVLTLPELS
jgi:hypothetical protein